MKKNLYIANLLVAGLMTFTGCTDGFESDNANKAGYTPELQEYDLQKYVLNLGVMQQGIYFNYDWEKVPTGLSRLYRIWVMICLPDIFTI